LASAEELNIYVEVSELILNEAYQSLGIEINNENVPTERSFILANSGQLDELFLKQYQLEN
jgi:hypothetical protein